MTYRRVLCKKPMTDLYMCPTCQMGVIRGSWVLYKQTCNKCHGGTAQTTDSAKTQQWVAGVPVDDQKRYLEDKALRDRLKQESVRKREEREEAERVALEKALEEQRKREEAKKLQEEQQKAQLA